MLPLKKFVLEITHIYEILKIHLYDWLLPLLLIPSMLLLLLLQLLLNIINIYC